MESNSLSYVSLAYRAGKALAGTAACEKGIKNGKIRLLLMQQGVSEGTKRNFLLLCGRKGVASRMVEGEDMLGRAVGRPGIMLLGITDQGLADAARNMIDGAKGRGINEQTENY